MGNCACFQGLPARAPLKERSQQPVQAQKAAIIVNDLILPGVSERQPGLGHTLEVKPAEEEKNVEVELAEGVRTEEAEPAANVSADGSTLAEDEHKKESKRAEEVKSVTGKGINYYMWMWGDCNPLATFDPLRWSEYQSAESMTHDLRWQQSKDMHRPVKIKDQKGGSWCFKTAEQAISAMTYAMEAGGQPCTSGQPTEADVKPPNNEKEEAKPAEVEEVLEIRSEQKEETELAEELPAGKDQVAAETSKGAASYMWMWGDCNPVATLNPKRWSEYQSAESMICDLQNQKSSNLSRPVKIKDRTVGDWRFGSVEEAILALTHAVERDAILCNR